MKTKNKLDCHVVEDLLPLYNEDLVSEKTKEQVEEHLNSCSSCYKNGKVCKKMSRIHSTQIKRILII